MASEEKAPGLLLGVHVAKQSLVLSETKVRKTYAEAIELDADHYGLGAVQIFTHGPRNQRHNNYSPAGIKRATAHLDLTVHGAYPIVNIWKLTRENLTTAEGKGYLKYVQSEIKACVAIEAWGLVLHVTKQEPAHVAFVMSQLQPLAEQAKVVIVLEMVAAKGCAVTYETPEKINTVTALINEAAKPPAVKGAMWWGWCIDTAHLWGAGVDVSTYEAVKDWLAGLKYPRKLIMFHLNGSESARGSGKDKHAACFSSIDKIWRGVEPAFSGVRAVVEHATKYHLTTICEIKRDSRPEVEKSIGLIRGLIPK
jgi:deoxyribonuclease-4